MCSPSLVFLHRSFACISFAVCPCITVLVTQHRGENLAMNGQATRTLLLKEDTVKLYLQTKSSKKLEVLGSGFSLKGLTKQRRFGGECYHFKLFSWF